MVGIRVWVTTAREEVGDHWLEHLLAREGATDTGVAWAAETLPEQYAGPDKIALILAKFGKPAAAKYLQGKLPSSKQTRSGDLGEIIGARYAEEELGYRTIPRLRWKDHPDMAMRGDDLFGVKISDSGPTRFLKGEAKSRAQLDSATLAEADEALQRDDGLPSPATMTFIADRLVELGEETLGLCIYQAQMIDGIAQDQVLQLIFTFTGSNPRNLLRLSTESYEGGVRRLVVGLQVPKHQAFIADVYAKVIADA